MLSTIFLWLSTQLQTSSASCICQHNIHGSNINDTGDTLQYRIHPSTGKYTLSKLSRNVPTIAYELKLSSL